MMVLGGLYTPFPWIYVVLGGILAFFILLIILFKLGILFIYEEEYVAEE